MGDIKSVDIPQEPGKRHPYENVSVGSCADIAQKFPDFDNAKGNKADAKCAAFRLNRDDMVIDSTGLTKGVVMTEEMLKKSQKNIGNSVSGINQAMDMMKP